MTSRREFLQMLAVAGSVSAACGAPRTAEAASGMMYDPPRFGNLSLLHIGDTHAQLLPAHVREASFYMGVGEFANRPPYLTGEDFCEYFRVMPQTLRAHAHSYQFFEDLSAVYGPTGGYAHIATVVKLLRASRPDSLLLDCGDSWMGSGLALWTKGQVMAEVTRELGVDAMTGDWEFALGAERLNDIVDGTLQGRTAFLGQNIKAVDPTVRSPARPHAIFFVRGMPVGVIGEAYPHIGGPVGRQFPRGLKFGIEEEHLQDVVDAVRAKGVRLVVLVSHAGLLADVKLAGRVSGIDVILSGHTHDALPEPMVVKARTGRTLVTSVGAHGKFVGALDLDLRDGRLRDYRFHLIPVFSRLVPPDPAMSHLIEEARKPFAADFARPVAVSQSTLFRRDNFMGSFDQVVLQAMLAARDAEIAFAPGYRFGATILPGESITFERVLDLLAVPDAGLREESLTGEQIKERLENWLDDLFNPDPYAQNGEDMVRSLGLTYSCDPSAGFGHRASELKVRGKSVQADQRYKVVSFGLRSSAVAGNTPIWQVVVDYLRQGGSVRASARQAPRVAGAAGNRGVHGI